MTNTILSILGGLASLSAVIALIFELRMSRLTLQTEALLHLSDVFITDRMIKYRQNAARNILLGNTENEALSEVLDNFSTIASLAQSGALNKKTINDMFGYWIIYYTITAKSYIESERKVDPNTWVNLEKFADKLEKRRGKNSLDISSKGIQHFLLHEADWTLSDFEKEKNKKERAKSY